MIGTYYTTEDNYKSTLVLNNKGPNQIVVTPILHGRNGETYNAPPVSVGGESSYEVDLNAIAEAAGSRFRSGGIEFIYAGRMMEMGGGLRIVHAEKSLIFDEQFLEPGMKFSSQQLEAVFAMPFEDARINVIVTNTTEKPLVVTGAATFAGDRNQRPLQLQLKPYETQIVSLPHGQTKEAFAGAVSFNHNGEKGALMAMIHVQDASRGYSESVNFHDPAQGKTNQLHGAGLWLGTVNNDALRQVTAVRNIGKDATTVAASVPYSKRDGQTGKISLPQLSLAPGEIKLLDTSNAQLRQRDFATAGLEIEYKGAPGGVIATASSVSQSGNQIFALPLKDPQGGMSSTGGYPWFIKESSSTVVFIKNVTGESQDFMIDVVHGGGRWGSKTRTLGPGQTFILDIRKLRDSGEKSSSGAVIPPDAASGHISWSVRGNRNKTLIGRAQTVDLDNGLASSYECQCICGWSWGRSQLSPSVITGFPGDTQLFLLQSRYNDCYGNESEWQTITGSYLYNYVTYYTDNSNVATIQAPGQGTAIAPGSTNLHADWTETVWESTLTTEGVICTAVAAAAACAAFCEVQSCPIPTGEHTMSVGWNAFAESKHDWRQRLLPVTTSFAGRRVYEEDPGGGGPDTCHMTGSAIPEFKKITNDPDEFWTVASGTNEWGSDTVGWGDDAVSYYRFTLFRVPCSTKFPQRMVITCGSQRQQYITQELRAGIQMFEVSSGRATQNASHPYP